MKHAIPRKKFYFVRHGSTDWNVKKLCQGHRDIELNESGRKEAEAISQAIANLQISIICTSPLKRALETAQIIHKVIPATPFQVIDTLKERSWGQLEGISSTEMYRMEEMEEIDPNYHIGQGVEERHSFQLRLIEGFTSALANDGVPLIVSHGRVFLSLCDIIGIPRIRQIPNAIPIQFNPVGSNWDLQLPSF